jgi:hypothetical protein
VRSPSGSRFAANADRGPSTRDLLMPRMLLWLAMIVVAPPETLFAADVVKPANATTRVLAPTDPPGTEEDVSIILLPSDEPLDGAKSAESATQWVLVRASSASCEPCKWMEETTWRDARVVKWLDEHATVVDVDTDREQSAAKVFQIEDSPVIIAFKDDKEFDRVGRYYSPLEFLDWLEGLARGETSIELLKQPSSVQTVERALVNPQIRLELARTLVQIGEDEQAADMFIWLWQNMLDHAPGMYGVRLSYMVSDMERLAARSKTAREKFAAIRDATGKRLEADKVALDDAIDWVSLNRVLDDSRATLAWYDRVKAERRKKPLINAVVRELEGLLIAEGRWADLARVRTDPLDMLQRRRRIEQHLSVAVPPTTKCQLERINREMDQYFEGYWSDEVGRTYAGLLAAALEEDASVFANKAREWFGAAPMAKAMVRWALQVNQPRRVHLQWLSASPKDEVAATLRRAVHRALKDDVDGKP